MRTKIVNIDIEKVVKGKNAYSIATVTYISNGEARTHKVMSFANPAVFKALPDLIGKEVEITVTKNDNGYNQWAAISEVEASLTAAPPPVAVSVRANGSNFETREERASKQVYIVKQSSIGSAIETLAAMGELSSPARVIEVAQIYVDYVMGILTDNSIEGMKSDEV